MVQSGVTQEVHNSILPTDHIQLRTQAAEKVRDTPAINGEFAFYLS